VKGRHPILISSTHAVSLFGRKAQDTSNADGLVDAHLVASSWLPRTGCGDVPLWTEKIF